MLDQHIKKSQKKYSATNTYL